MDLRHWLEVNNISLAEFAVLADSTINRAHEWAKGSCSIKVMARIEAITQGQVTALSFFPEEKSFAKAGAAAIQAKISNPKKKVTR